MPVSPSGINDELNLKNRVVVSCQTSLPPVVPLEYGQIKRGQKGERGMSWNMNIKEEHQSYMVMVMDMILLPHNMDVSESSLWLYL